MKKPPIPMNVKIAIYNLYKLENKRASEIAQMFRCSVQHVFRIIREMEGKPNWKRQQVSIRTKNKDLLLTEFSPIERRFDDRYKQYNNR
jgi:CTP-dependent riboflavin kinase